MPVEVTAVLTVSPCPTKVSFSPLPPVVQGGKVALGAAPAPGAATVRVAGSRGVGAAPRRGLQDSFVKYYTVGKVMSADEEEDEEEEGDAALTPLDEEEEFWVAGSVVIRAVFDPTDPDWLALDAVDDFGPLSVRNFAPAFEQIRLVVRPRPPALRLRWCVHTPRSRSRSPSPTRVVSLTFLLVDHSSSSGLFCYVRSAPAPITYGERLSELQLDASTVPTTPGVFHYWWQERESGEWVPMRSVEVVDLWGTGGDDDEEEEEAPETDDAGGSRYQSVPTLKGTWRGLLAATFEYSPYAPTPHTLKVTFTPARASRRPLGADGEYGDAWELTVPLTVLRRATAVVWGPRMRGVEAGADLAPALTAELRVVTDSDDSSGGSGSGAVALRDKEADDEEEASTAGGFPGLPASPITYFYSLSEPSAEGDPRPLQPLPPGHTFPVPDSLLR